MIAPMYGLCEAEDDAWAKIDDAHIPAEGGELPDGETKDIVGTDDGEAIQPGKPLP